MIVIKAVTRHGLCLEDYGAQITYPFAEGSKEKCLDEIKRDVVFNAKCEKDSGSRLVFYNGRSFDGEDYDISHLEEYLKEDMDRGMIWHVIKLEADDEYKSVYEMTYQIFQEWRTA